jgi:cysteine-rich repeat protein
LTGCVNCSSLITCYQCDTNSSYGLSYVNANTCSGCNESCICDGYGTPWIPNAHTCTPICGDGLLRLTEYCDNNNKVSGDGCSITCIIEPFWNCDKS